MTPEEVTARQLDIQVKIFEEVFGTDGQPGRFEFSTEEEAKQVMSQIATMFPPSEHEQPTKFFGLLPKGAPVPVARGSGTLLEEAIDEVAEEANR
jgi:hypothetical protein